MSRIAMQAAAAGASAGRSPEHAITALDAFPVREPSRAHSYTVLRLSTDSGLTGWGECGPISQAEFHRVREMIVGKPATSWAVLETGTRLDGGINMAMLDASARAVGAPVYRLLGGPTRFKARAITTLQGDSDGALQDSLNRAYSAGHRAFIVPLPHTQWRNQGQAFHLAVRKRLSALRSAQGGVDFVLGGNGRLTAGDASSIAASCEEYHPLWFDEPCPATNIATIRKVSEESVVPLGFGRFTGRGSLFQDYLREGVVDLLRPDLHEYGISGIRRLAALAETYYTAVAPNQDGGPVATAAALHLAASLPNFFIQHVPIPEDERDRQMRDAIVSSELERVQDGFLKLPGGTGLGIEVNAAALEQHKGAFA